MGQLIFIAAEKDTSSIYSTCIFADSVEELRNELTNCMGRVITAIEETLKVFANKGVIDFDPIGGNKASAAILALYDGIAFQLLLNDSSDLDNTEYWQMVKRMLLAVLKNK